MIIDRESVVLCIGPSHQTAGLATREKFALSVTTSQHVCRSLHALDSIDEVVAVGTCNRSEIFVVTPVDLVDQAAEDTIRAFAGVAGLNVHDVRSLLTVRTGPEATLHIMRLAGGIESVVVGEAQIQGQLRQAHQFGLDENTAGPILDRLFRRALEVGKQARTATSIAEGHASIGSVAAELVADKLGGSLDQARVVVVGAGKMGGLAARSLSARGARQVDVANRRVDRARLIASECGGEGVAFTDLDHELAICDAVVSSTNAPHYLLSPERLERAMTARDGRGIVLVDLAVPRDIDPACGELAGVHLYDLDDLELVVSRTLAQRGEAVDAVANLARIAATEFAEWQSSRRATSSIIAVRAQAELVRAREFAQFVQDNEHMSDDDLQAVERLTRTVMQRMLHEQTVAMREAARKL